MAERHGKRQGSRAFIRVVAIVAAMALAGCQSLLPRATRPIEAPTAGPPVRVEPPVVTAGIPQDTARHRVALLVPLSGANASVGQSLANATQLALLDANAQTVRITSYDTATGAAAAAQRAIAEGNRLILGPLLSEDVRAVAPIAKRAGVPVVSYSNDTNVAGNGAYVMGYTPSQSIERVVDYARRSGITEFAGLMPRGLYGERASTTFLRSVDSSGGRVVGIQTYDRSQGSINSAVAKLNGSSPFQAILIADSAGTASLAVPAIRKGNSARARVMGTELWNTDASVAGSAMLNDAWFASVSDGLYRQYATKYRSRFGSAPFRLSSLGYDSVLLTVRIARDWRIGDPFPEARLTSVDGFAGLDGAFRFMRNGVVERALEVQEIKGGAVTVVSPAPKSFGK